MFGFTTKQLLVIAAVAVVAVTVWPQIRARLSAAGV